MKIHAQAMVDPEAVVGNNVEIGPGAVIEARVVIGDDTVIGPHAVIREFTTLGPQCRVHAGAVIGDTPQDLAFKNVRSYVRIGARCVMREGVTIQRGTKEDTETVVGDDCYLMVNSHLAHNVTLGNRVIMANGALLGGYVSIGDGAFVSGNAVVHQFCHVGRLAMIGGLSGISKDVPPFCMTKSTVKNTIIGLNVIGLRRNGFDSARRRQVRECFDILFHQGLNISQAIDVLQQRENDPAAQEFIEFIRTSKRGICKGSAHSEDDED